ncbi:hypothetical protein V1515DRAFT_611874 [Lipomyces mesembrius]
MSYSGAEIDAIFSAVYLAYCRKHYLCLAVRGGRRPNRSKTVRAMATWSHYKFQGRLLNKAREHKSCKVVLSLRPTVV